jgi:hypothetical protein
MNHRCCPRVLSVLRVMGSPLLSPCALGFEGDGMGSPLLCPPVLSALRVMWSPLLSPCALGFEGDGMGSPLLCPPLLSALRLMESPLLCPPLLSGLRLRESTVFCPLVLSGRVRHYLLQHLWTQIRSMSFVVSLRSWIRSLLFLLTLIALLL